MGELLRNHRGFVVGLFVVGLMLLAGSVAASTLGWGADRPPREEERGQAVRGHGGAFLIFYGGGFGRSARGVGGRGFVGGGPGMGK